MVIDKDDSDAPPQIFEKTNERNAKENLKAGNIIANQEGWGKSRLYRYFGEIPIEPKTQWHLYAK